MKRILPLFTTILIALIITSCNDKPSLLPNESNYGSTTNKIENQSKEIINSESDANNQLQANEHLLKIYTAFGLNTNNDFSNFPGYYGGAFINSQGKLVVFIKGDIIKYKKSIYNIIKSHDFVVQPCKHSYKILAKIMSDLNSFKLNESNKVYSNNFNAFALMDAKNKIVVELDECNETTIANFKKSVMNSDAIVFEKSTGRLVEEGSLNPGCKAEVSVNGSYGSYAFRAKRNSDLKYGMVTAGHVISTGGILYSNGVNIGSCTISQNSGSVDAAFVPINNTTSYTPSNELCGTSTFLSTSTSLPGVGTTVNMRGAYTGTSSGTIISTNATTTNEAGVTFNNLTSADYTSASGDSGGVIYTYVSSTNVRATVGIHKGNNGLRVYFTKANLALSALGVSRY